jgi:hypothetical protein
VRNLYQKLEYVFYRRFGKFFIKKPKRLLQWTAEDFETGKRWAMTQPHPYDYGQTLTLWDYVQQYKDSTLIIHELNLRINEQ